MKVREKYALGDANPNPNANENKNEIPELEVAEIE